MCTFTSSKYQHRSHTISTTRTRDEWHMFFSTAVSSHCENETSSHLTRDSFYFLAVRARVCVCVGMRERQTDRDRENVHQHMITIVKLYAFTIPVCGNILIQLNCK